jgi:hypothetical protein
MGDDVLINDTRCQNVLFISATTIKKLFVVFLKEAKLRNVQRKRRTRETVEAMKEITSR